MIARCALVAALLTAVCASAAPAAPPALVQHDYLLSCAGCHRFDGSGSERFPSLYDTGRLLRVPGGRDYLASVPGVAQAPLSDDRLAAVLNWMLEEFGGVYDFERYQADEVARLRSQPLVAPREARRQLTAATE